MLSAFSYSNQAVTLNVDVSKIEIRNDFGSFLDGQKTVVGYAFVESDFEVEVDPRFSIKSKAVFEPIYARQYYQKHYSNNVFFKDQGLYIKDLYANYGSEKGSVFLGKFAPEFGKAFNDDSGIWSNLGLPQKYEVYERIGIGGRKHTRWLRNTQPLTLSASLFKPDTTPLQHSWFADRYTENPPSMKTKELESMAIQASSRYNDLFDYYLGYRSIAHPKASHETGYVAGIVGDALVNGMAVSRLLEYTHLVNHDGRDAISSYWTYSVHGEKDFRLYSIAYTKYESADDQASQFQVSTGYRFKNNMVWDIGLQYTTGKQKEWYIGSRLSIPIQSYTRSIALENTYQNYEPLVQNGSTSDSSYRPYTNADTASPTPFPGFY